MIWHAPPKPSAQWPPRSIETRPGVTKAGGPRNRFAAFRRCREAVFAGYSPACGRKRTCFYLCGALKNDGIRRSRRLAYPHPCFPAGHRGRGRMKMPPPSPAVQQAGPEESDDGSVFAAELDHPALNADFGGRIDLNVVFRIGRTKFDAALGLRKKAFDCDFTALQQRDDNVSAAGLYGGLGDDDDCGWPRKLDNLTWCKMPVKLT